MMSKARRQFIVGRRAELNLFRDRVLCDPPSAAALHVHGSPGVGKSTLLGLFADSALDRGFAVVAVDGRDVDATPPGLVRALCASAGVDDFDAFDHMLMDRPTVIMVDTYEALSVLDPWIRERFTPLLPGSTRVVLSGRSKPTLEWLTSPSLAGLHHSLQVRNLDRASSREILRRRQVPDREHAAILDFTHGHPLALSLVAELFQQDPDLRFDPVEAPAVVHRLVETLLDSVADPERRAAIELSALVRTTTEELLATALGIDDPVRLFSWLADLSFIETHPRGVAPHDLAREALARDLKWRNPNRFVELHDRARAHYRIRLETVPTDHVQTLMDYVYLHRDSPFVGPYMDFSGEGEAHMDVFHPDDAETILAMVRAHEGGQSAAIAQRWLERAPSWFTIVRAPLASMAGFFLQLPLHELTPHEVAFDPVAAPIVEATSVALRDGESALLFRYWMSGSEYQGISPVQSRIFIEMVHRYLTTPRLVQSYLICAEPLFWEALFAYADMPRHTMFEGPGYGVFGHDWRARPPVAWLDLLAAREVAEEPVFVVEEPAMDLVVLAEKEFRSAVHDALRNYGREAALRASPLLRSSLVVRRLAGGEPVESLRQLIKEAAEKATSSEDTAKLYPALYHGFLNPAPNHEAAARQAHMSYSTFRRYVATARDLVADQLWELETSGP